MNTTKTEPTETEPKETEPVFHLDKLDPDTRLYLRRVGTGEIELSPPRPGTSLTMGWLNRPMSLSRYLLLVAPVLLLFYVAASFSIARIIDGTIATATFYDDLPFRLLCGVAWVVLMLIVGLKHGEILINRQKASASRVSAFQLHDTFMKINWTRGLLRLWLVGSLTWAASVGWLTWPPIQPYDRFLYWHYRVAHPGDYKEMLLAAHATLGATHKAAIADIRARYDKTRVPRTSHTGPMTDNEMRAVTLNNQENYERRDWEITKEELDEVDATYNKSTPEWDEFTGLTMRLDETGERIKNWATYTFTSTIAFVAVGAGLLWALRGFRQTP
jgi:hypothetical protein